MELPQCVGGGVPTPQQGVAVPEYVGEFLVDTDQPVTRHLTCFQTSVQGPGVVKCHPSSPVKLSRSPSSCKQVRFGLRMIEFQD